MGKAEEADTVWEAGKVEEADTVWMADTAFEKVYGNLHLEKRMNS